MTDFYFDVKDCKLESSMNELYSADILRSGF